MTYDAATRISNNQSLIGVVTPIPAVSDSSIKIIGLLGGPTSLTGRDIGNSADLAFRVHVTQAFTGGVGAVDFSVVMSSDPLLGLGGLTILGVTSIFASALFLGNEFDIRIPALSELNVATGLEYIGLAYTPDVAPVTGAISAWIPLGHSPNKPRRLQANYTGPS